MTTTTLLGIAAAYVVMSVLLLTASLSAPFRWWIKAVAIVVSSFFFVEIFFATKGLLGWPGTGRLPPQFQLLWTRVVEPDPQIRDPGAIFLWVEELDRNHVPVGIPRSYRLAYSKPMADKVIKARDEIMQGNEEEGTAEDIENDSNEARAGGQLPNDPDQSNTAQAGPNNLDPALLQNAQIEQNIRFAPYQGPLLPPK
jgi:hypothetical protein